MIWSRKLNTRSKGEKEVWAEDVATKLSLQPAIRVTLSNRAKPSVLFKLCFLDIVVDQFGVSQIYMAKTEN